MAGFFYFIKGSRRDKIENLILSTDLKQYANDIGERNYCNLDGGGHIFSIHGKDQGIDVSIRDGLEMQDFGKYKIIYEIANPPKPEDFLKKDAISGHMVELQDGNQWMIPMARHFDQGSLLPVALCISNGGEYIEQPIDKFLDLCEISELVLEDYLITMGQYKGDKNYTEIKDVFIACSKIIQTNYNISFQEISMLKLITSHNYNKIMGALIDWQFVRQLLEENVSENISDEKKTLNLLKEGLDSTNL